MRHYAPSVARQPLKRWEIVVRDRRGFDDRIGFMGGATVAYLLFYGTITL